MRKRVLWVGVLVALGIAAFFVTRAKTLAVQPGVTLENARLRQAEMKLEEVEAIMGKPGIQGWLMKSREVPFRWEGDEFTVHILFLNERATYGAIAYLVMTSRNPYSRDRDLSSTGCGVGWGCTGGREVGGSVSWVATPRVLGAKRPASEPSVRSIGGRWTKSLRST